jgi:hypothetical protein
MDNKQIKDGLGDLFTLRSRDVSTNLDGSVQRSMFYSTPYPLDYVPGGGGIFQRCDTSGVFLSGMGTLSPVYSFLWTPTPSVAAITRLRISAWSGGTAFSAAAMGMFSIVIARNFTVPDSGGTGINFIDGSSRLRVNMAYAQATIMIAGNSALTPGTRTLDSAPLDQKSFMIPTTANTLFTATPLTLFEKISGEQPLVLQANEGFIVNAQVPGSGSWSFSASLEWAGLQNY